MKSFIYSLIISALIFSGCTKMEDKKKVEDKPNTSNNLPTDHPPVNNTSSRDEKVAIFKKDAEDADAKYEKDKSEGNKKNAIDKNLAAGNYMMFDADVPPKEKYRPALKYYRRVLELDPKNKDAAVNKDKIEEIYTQMGLPIPQ